MRSILISTAAASLLWVGAASAQTTERPRADDPTTRTDDHLLAHPSASIAGETKAEAAARSGETSTPSTGAHAGHQGVSTGSSHSGHAMSGGAMAGQTGMQGGPVNPGVRSYMSSSSMDPMLVVRIVTNGPIPDTVSHRTMYPPLSLAGKRTRVCTSCYVGN